MSYKLQQFVTEQGVRHGESGRLDDEGRMEKEEFETSSEKQRKRTRHTRDNNGKLQQKALGWNKVDWE